MKLKETKEVIELLESINPNDDYAYERAVLAYLKLGGLPIIIYEIKPNLTDTIILKTFHTRTHENNEDFFLRISDISIPPRDCVKNFARCNRPFQSVFYGSENRPTSYMELMDYWLESREVGDILKVTIGLWEFKKPIKTIIVTTPDKNMRISDFDIAHGLIFDELIAKYEGEELESQKIFYRYLFDKFRKSAKKDIKTYIITSAYCNVALMHSRGQAEAIYYPSVPAQYNGVNFAINKDFFNYNNLELKSAVRNEFEVILNQNKTITFREKSSMMSKEIKLSENRIMWF